MIYLLISKAELLLLSDLNEMQVEKRDMLNVIP